MPKSAKHNLASSLHSSRPLGRQSHACPAPMPPPPRARGPASGRRMADVQSVRLLLLSQPYRSHEMSEFIICDAQPLQCSKQLLILDQALHNSVNGSIGFVVMIDLHKDDEVLEDHVDNYKMIGDMQAAKAPQFMCLWYTDLWVQDYALDLLDGLFLENRIFLGQFGELLIKVTGSDGGVFHFLDQRLSR